MMYSSASLTADVRRGRGPWVMFRGRPAFPALVGSAIADATPAKASLAPGFLDAAQQVCGALGLAVLATVARERVGTLTDEGEAALSARSLLVGAGLLGPALSLPIAVPNTATAPAKVAAAESPKTEQTYSEV